MPKKAVAASDRVPWLREFPEIRLVQRDTWLVWTGGYSTTRPGLSTGRRYCSAVDQRRRNRALRTQLPSHNRPKNERHGFGSVSFVEQANLPATHSYQSFAVARRERPARMPGCARRSRLDRLKKADRKGVRCTGDYCSCVVGKCRPPLNHSHARTRCFNWPRRNLQNHIAEGRLDNRASKAHNGQ